MPANDRINLFAGDRLTILTKMQRFGIDIFCDLIRGHAMTAMRQRKNYRLFNLHRLESFRATNYGKENNGKNHQDQIDIFLLIPCH